MWGRKLTKTHIHELLALVPCDALLSSQSCSISIAWSRSSYSASSVGELIILSSCWQPGSRGSYCFALRHHSWREPHESGEQDQMEGHGGLRIPQPRQRWANYVGDPFNQFGKKRFDFGRRDGFQSREHRYIELIFWKHAGCRSGRHDWF